MPREKDYDGPILVVSTRYWPRGGGYFEVENFAGQPVKIKGNEERPDVKPSATASLMLVSKEEGYEPGEHTTIATHDFEGETFEEVSRQVEAWAQDIMNLAIEALKAKFKIPATPGD